MCALFVVYVTVCCRGINTITKKLLVMMSCGLVVCVCCCGINIVTKKLLVIMLGSKLLAANLAVLYFP